MYKELTTEQLRQAVESMFGRRFAPTVPPHQLNLRFNPSFEDCDGPSHSISYRFHTYEWMANPANMTHGGIIATLFDNAMGMTCSTFYKSMTPTITLTVNYCRPVPLDVDIIIRARAVTTGGSNAQLTAEMFFPGQPNVILATASAVYHTAQAVKKGTSDLI